MATTSGSFNIKGSHDYLSDGTLSWSIKSSSAANNTHTLNITVTILPYGVDQYYDVTIYSTDHSTKILQLDLRSANPTIGGRRTATATLTLTGSNVTGASSGFNRTFDIITECSKRPASESHYIRISLSDLPAIDRRSKPTVPSSITLGSNFTVTTNRVNSSFTHTVQLAAGNSTFTNLATGVGASSSTINAPIATYAPRITSVVTVTGVLRVYTYSGSTSLGYIDKSVTVNVPSSCAPILGDISISDTNGYYSRFGGFLSSLSRLHLAWSETISYSSAIVSRTGQILGKTAILTNASSTGCDINIASLDDSTGTASITIKDGRGRTATKTTSSFKVYRYAKPSLSSTKVYRCNSEGASEPEGEYLAVNLAYSKTALKDGQNTDQNYVQVEAFINGASTSAATYGSVEESTDAITGVHILPGTYNVLTSDTVVLTITDTVGQFISITYTVPSASRPISVRTFTVDDQKTWGMAIGKVAEIPDALEVAVKTYFYNTGIFKYAGGSVYLRNTSITVGETPQTSNYGPTVSFQDGDGTGFATVGGQYITDGKLGAYIQAARSVNGSTVYNKLSLMLDASGNRTVTVTESAPWRTALDIYSKSESDSRYVNATGDTMTGDLVIARSAETYCTVRRMDLTGKIGSPPSASAAFGAFRIMDSAGNSVGWLRVEKNTADSVNLRITARRANASNTQIENSLNLGINSSGTRTVDVSDAGIWRSAIGAVNKAGDTITGDLNSRYSSFDVSKSNNNVSSTLYPTTFNICDTANRIVARQEGLIYANGNTGSNWYVRNYNTSGTQVAQKGISMVMDKSGNFTYGISDPGKFRQAIGMNYNWAMRTNLGNKTGSGTTETKIFESGNISTIPVGTYLVGLSIPLAVNQNTATARLRIGSTAGDELVSVITNCYTAAGAGGGSYSGVNTVTGFNFVTLSKAYSMSSLIITVQGQAAGVNWTVLGYNTTSYFMVKLY